MLDILQTIDNLTRETEFEAELVKLTAKPDATGRLWVEVITRKPSTGFNVSHHEPERRRFTTNPQNEVVVEIHDGEGWIPEADADWLKEG
jgi:hypothetical protein